MASDSNDKKQNLVKEIKNLPQGNDFYAALSIWDWSTIDDVLLPCVFRNNEKYVPVHIVEMHLLAKFPPNLPREMADIRSVECYKMTILEAWIFNTVNCLERKFEFGYRLFTPSDEVVKLSDVESFYFALKNFYLPPVQNEVVDTTTNGEAVYFCNL